MLCEGVILTTSPVGIEASEKEIGSMISVLKNVGKVLEPLDLKVSLNGLPEEVIFDKEKITRFLLLAAFLDQQAESPTARRTAVSIYNTFGDDLFFKPQSVLLRMGKLVPLKGGYKISPAIGRVLPRFGWIVLRVGGFLIYEMMLGDKRLSEELGRRDTPTDAIFSYIALRLWNRF